MISTVKPGKAVERSRLELLMLLGGAGATAACGPSGPPRESITVVDDGKGNRTVVREVLPQPTGPLRTTYKESRESGGGEGGSGGGGDD